MLSRVLPNFTHMSYAIDHKIPAHTVRQDCQRSLVTAQHVEFSSYVSLGCVSSTGPTGSCGDAHRHHACMILRKTDAVPRDRGTALGVQNRRFATYIPTLVSLPFGCMLSWACDAHWTRGMCSKVQRTRPLRPVEWLEGGRRQKHGMGRYRPARGQLHESKSSKSGIS